MILANTVNGNPLDATMYPLRLVGPGLTGGQKVSQIASIELIGLPWLLTLSGWDTQGLFRPDFETAAAANPGTWIQDASNTWSGTPLWRLVALVDDDDPTTFNNDIATAGYTVKITATDGYFQTFASADVANNGNMIIANILNGNPLDVTMYPLRLVGPGLTGGQKVSQIASIELIGLPLGYSLNLAGFDAYTMFQPEFEDGAECHPVSWTDGSGNVWSGIPLWYLVGYVDDNIQHGAGAFNDALAAAGYTVKVKSVGDTSTYERSFSSATVARNNNIIVANKMNGADLAADKYPLYLIGSGLAAGADKVKQITDIELVGLPWGLTLSGARDQYLPFDLYQ
jgi:DMSO/TMAO reductase YedYZ molybdopterin-dependent catalytic subunit